MTRFFIGRPIFAGVISIVITLAGLVASRVLPIAQYPEIAPPTVTVTAAYPGASAETIARTVAAPIEEQLSGVEGLLYYTSSSASNGSLTITATFEVGTDINNAVIQVNNRVQIATPRLPDDVRRGGVVVQKRSSDILMAVAVKSGDPRYDTLFLSNYMTVNVLDVIKRVPGVADAFIFGARDYSMRVWLKPDRMAQLGVTTTDVANAIRAQNAQYAAGKIGQEPAPDSQSTVYTVTAQGRLLEPEQFGNIILRSSGPGGTLRLKDVARLELGAVAYDAFTSVDGQPTVGVAVFLQSGANALSVAQSVIATMNDLSRAFPEGVDYIVPYDSTRFIEASIREVVHTLLIAALLVIGVVFLFLQNWRATLIPVIAVPVSLIGTFAGLYAFGYSINTLTLFAMVLAIGIVVDDAIVVLENVERLMAERGLSPREAAIEAMREVAAAVVAIVLVLCAVFIPVAFLGGIAGRLYQQFAVTVAIAVVISGMVALTLSPAMCALLLKPSHKESPVFRPFNRGFAALSRGYLAGVRWLLGHAALALAAFAVVAGLSFWLIHRVPTGFVPGRGHGLPLRRRHPARRRHADAHRAPRRRGAEDAAGESRGGPRVRDHRLRPDRRRQQDQYRDHVRRPQALGRTQGQRQRHGRLRLRQDGGDARRPGARLQPAADPRPGHGRGLRVLPAEPGRQRPEAPGPDAAAVPRRAAQAPGPDRHQQLLPHRRAADLRRRGPREGARARRAPVRRVRRAAGNHGLDLRQRLQQVRAHLPRADPGRRAVPPESRGPRQRLRALGERRHAAAQGAAQDPAPGRTGAARPLQRLRLGEGARRRRARHQLRPGDRRGRGSGGENPAPRLLRRLVGPGVPGEAHRQGGDLRLFLRASSWCS